LKYLGVYPVGMEVFCQSFVFCVVCVSHCLGSANAEVLATKLHTTPAISILAATTGVSLTVPESVVRALFNNCTFGNNNLHYGLMR